MKILLFGDASNYHHALAVGLRAEGHDVTVASDGSRWMDTARDIDISRADNRLGGALLWARLTALERSKLKGYDVVQLASPSFVRLRPHRLEKLLRQLKSDNGAVYLTALGTDSSVVRNLTSPQPALPYSEWHRADGLRPWALSPQAEKDAWLATELMSYTDTLYNSVDGIVSALYEYQKIAEAEYPGLPISYGGIPIDTSSIPYKQKDTGENVKILYTAHYGREAEKGADILLPMLQRLQKELPDKITLISPPNVPYSQFLGLLSDVDMVCDQLYSFTPATTALLAMSAGAVPISGGEEAYYDFIGEHELRPIFNPDPDDIEGTYRRLKQLILNPDELRKMQSQTRTFVERHNEATLVARRFLDAWK